MATQATQFSLISLFESTTDPTLMDILPLDAIKIPIIQRDYAQGRETQDVERIRRRFLDALYNAIVPANAPGITLDFVFGTIDKKVLYPLDGQQRLTTLYLLHWYVAKHEAIVESRTGVLTRFSYETRYSARDFCQHLVSYNPDFSKSNLSDELIDQYWMPIDWQYDPTIRSMLVMLDAIHEKFNDTIGLWDKLEAGIISFYFQPLNEMGLNDDLYIKMNSRGKPLTDFEHFKADWERLIGNIDGELRTEVENKVDGDWTDVFWKVRDKDHQIDKAFVNYFLFLCDILRFRNGWGKYYGDLLDINKQLFTGINGRSNVEFIISGMDCWVGVNIDNLFNRFLSNGKVHVPGKSLVSTVNLFKDCCEKYEDMLTQKVRSFPIPKIILLYTFTKYLQLKAANHIDELKFERRLRIINNLIRGSEYELREDRMKELLGHVDFILESGTIENKNSPFRNKSFNSNQLDEEIEKEQWLLDPSNAANAPKLYKLEDHETLFGAVRVVGLNHVDWLERFYSLFCCDRSLVHRALLTFGNYSMLTSNRYLFGSIINNSWRLLFRNNQEAIMPTHNALEALLCTHESFTNAILTDIIDAFITEKDNSKEYDWIYYMVKYKEMDPQRYGMYCWGENHTPQDRNSYNIISMYTEKYLNGRNYQAYNRAVWAGLCEIMDPNDLIIGDYAYQGYDAIAIRSIELQFSLVEDALVVYKEESGNLVEKNRYPIQQNANGIDTIDRIKFSVEKIIDCKDAILHD